MLNDYVLFALCLVVSQIELGRCIVKNGKAIAVMILIMSVVCFLAVDAYALGGGGGGGGRRSSHHTDGQQFGGGDSAGGGQYGNVPGGLGGQNPDINYNNNSASVPEPLTLTLLGLGLMAAGGAAVVRSRYKNKK